MIHLDSAVIDDIVSLVRCQYDLLDKFSLILPSITSLVYLEMKYVDHKSSLQFSARKSDEEYEDNFASTVDVIKREQLTLAYSKVDI